MEKTDVVVAFRLMENDLKSDFRGFLNEHLSEDMKNVFSGEVDEETLREIKQEAGEIEYDGEHPQDTVAIYTHETLGIERETY